MRCEVLRFKPGNRRVAIVRSDTSPRIMGEVPLTKEAVVKVGDWITLKVWFHTTEAGRISAKVFSNGSIG